MIAAKECSDATIIERARNSPDEFAAIFDRHYRMIYAYAARRLGATLAEDVAAETFLIAFDRRDGYAGRREDARPWLYGIASNLIARYHRGEQRMYRAMARASGEQAVDVESDGVEQRVDAAGVRGRLANGLAGLGEGDRTVLLLMAWGGLNSHEIGEALDLPAGTVRSRLHRARKAMRAAMGNDDLTLLPEVAA